ncbi:unnamed protein product [Effrenium voratum]|nr:unnamed protein product [Effrenium voratum]
MPSEAKLAEGKAIATAAATAATAARAARATTVATSIMASGAGGAGGACGACGACGGGDSPAVDSVRASSLVPLGAFVPLKGSLCHGQMQAAMAAISSGTVRLLDPLDVTQKFAMPSSVIATHTE